MNRNKQRRVVVTGLGTVSALGQGADLFSQALARGKCGITPLEISGAEDLKCRIGVQLKGFDPNDHFDSRLIPQLDRHAQFALVAAREAVAGSGLTDMQLRNSAAVIGTGCGGKETDEITYHQLYKAGKRRVHPLTIPRGMPSAAASIVSMQLGIAGPVFSISSACASSNHAIIQACQMIHSGLVETVVCGGADAPFTFGLLKSWEAMRVQAPDSCRPFSAERKGLVLGEGAGVVVLESLQSARKRNANIYAEMVGFGMSADAGHITDPSPEGAARAMSMALQMAGITPDVIDYINAHGTGTQANDLSETQAIHQIFAEASGHLQISSTKSAHGHALGAAGGLELVATLLAMRDGYVPATLNSLGPGEGCDLDYVFDQPRAGKINYALSNSFAFGGLNAVLALQSGQTITG